MKIRTWRERLELPTDFPLACATAAERAMEEEIAELRKAVLTREERWAALRWLDVTRLYAFTEPVDDALAAKLEALA